MAYAKRAAAFDTIRSDLEKVGAMGDVLKKESEFAESFNVKTAATTGSRKDSAFQSVPETVSVEERFTLTSSV